MSNDNDTNLFSSKNGHSWLEKNDPANIDSNQLPQPSTGSAADGSKNVESGKRITLRRITPESLREKTKNQLAPEPASPSMAVESNTGRELDDANSSEQEFLLEFYPPVAEIVRQPNLEQPPVEFVTAGRTISDTVEPSDVPVDRRLQQIDIAASAIRKAMEQRASISEPRSEQPEPTDAWIDEQKTRKGHRSNDGDQSPSAATVDFDDAQVSAMVDAIINRFPVASPAVMLFVGDEANPQINEATAKICAELEQRDLGRILLVDSDFQERGLTEASGFGEEPGLAEAFSGSVHWRESVQTHSTSRLEFLSTGKDRMHWYHIAPKRLDQITADMKSKYQYVCVAGGAADSRSAKIWMNHCCGTYLIVSLKTSTETMAQSAVAELRSNGARLMGCVVTDLDPRG